MRIALQAHCIRINTLASKKSEVMPVDIPSYLADTSHLTPLQHGCYLLALMHEWIRGPLPDDMSQVARVMRLSGVDANRIALALLSAFFSRDKDGRWKQKRLEKEKDKMLERAERRHASAVIAAAARWKGHVAKRPSKDKKNVDANRIAIALQSHAQRKPVSSRAGIHDAGAEGSKNLKAKAKAKPVTPHPSKHRLGVGNARASLRTAAASRKPPGASLGDWQTGSVGIRLSTPRGAKESSPEPIAKGKRKQNRANLAAEAGNVHSGVGNTANGTTKQINRFIGHNRKLPEGQKTPSGKKSGARRERKAKGGFEDGRFFPFQREVFDYWKGQNPDAPKCEWKKRESAVLRELLVSNPELTLEAFKKCLQHRAHSDVNPADLPHTWLRDVLRFAAGALDRYGKLLRVQ